MLTMRRVRGCEKSIESMVSKACSVSLSMFFTSVTEEPFDVTLHIIFLQSMPTGRESGLYISCLVWSM